MFPSFLILDLEVEKDLVAHYSLDTSGIRSHSEFLTGHSVSKYMADSLLEEKLAREPILPMFKQNLGPISPFPGSLGICE